MKTAYFQCSSGISGDMFIGSLINAGLDFARLGEEISKLGVTDYRLEHSKTTRGGISASKFEVIIGEDPRESRRLDDILDIVETSSLDKGIKETAVRIFANLAMAEAQAHAASLSEVHFHEVGALDAIIDVVGAAAAIKLMGIERVLSSPVNLGAGTVRSSHGELPVPAPAVVELLKGKPVFSNGPPVELTTPTGAAILSALAEFFGPLPLMEIQATGRGAGSRDFPEMPNILSVFVGLAQGEENVDTVAVIEANIDDMNPEFYAPFMEKAMEAGALDVFLTPVQMKKGRPGIKVTVLAQLSCERELKALLFSETTTFGVRVRYEAREKLKRKIVEVETVHGKVKIKLGKVENRVVQVSPEADSCLEIATRKKIPVKMVYDEAKRAAEALNH